MDWVYFGPKILSAGARSPTGELHSAQGDQQEFTITCLHIGQYLMSFSGRSTHCGDSRYFLELVDPFWHQVASCGASVGPLVQQVQNQGAFWYRLGAFGDPFGSLWGAFGTMLASCFDVVFEACFRMPFLIVFGSFFFHFWYHVGCFFIPKAPIARFTETCILVQENQWF